MTVTRWPTRAAKTVVTRNAALSVVTATVTPIPWDTVVEDDEGMWSAGDPTKLFARRPGEFEFKAVLDWVANTASYRELYLLKNGSVVYSHQVYQPSAVTSTGMEAVADIKMVVGDYVQAICSHNTGSGLSIVPSTSTDFETMMEARWAGP